MFVSVRVPRNDALACFLCMRGCVLMWVYCVPPLMEGRDQLCSLGVVHLDFVFFSLQLFIVCEGMYVAGYMCHGMCVGIRRQLGGGGFLLP